MNRKQFIFLLVLVVLFGAAGLIVHRRGNESWQTGGQSIGQKVLPNLAVNDIAQITIQSGTNELHLARHNNLWRVGERGDYPANFSEISSMLLKLADLKVAQSEEVGASQLGRFELLPPGPGSSTATRIEFKNDSGKTLDSLLLGKKHMNKSGGDAQFAGMGGGGWPDGRYVMAGSGAKTLALVSDPLDTVQPKPESWLNKDFFRIEKPRSIEVAFPEATNSWLITRASETNEWQLADAKAEEKTDSSKLSSVTTAFSSPSFEDVLPAATAPSISGMTNLTTVTVQTFDGFTYKIKIGGKESDNFPMSVSVAAELAAERPAVKDEKPADKTRLDKEFADRQKPLVEKLANEKALENWIYRVPTYVVDQLLKPRHELLVEPKKETASAAK